MTRHISRWLLWLLVAVFAWPAVVAAQTTAVLTSTTCPGTGCVTINAGRFGSIVIQINDQQAGTWTAQFETSNDGSGFKPLTSTTADGTTAATSTGSSNVFIVAGGSSAVRVRLSAYTSGAPVVTLNGSPASPPANVSASVSASNPASSATGSAVPAQTSYTGVNVAGTLRGITGFSLGTAFAPAMAIVDGSGNQITSFGGGTQYATGAAQATPTGTTALGWDGANVRALSTNSSGHLNVIFPSAQAVTQSGTWNLTNISGTISLPTGASQDATITGRLPAGASPADAESNTNTSLSRIGGFNFVYNGTTWDRLRGDTTSGAWVNVKNTATVAGGKTNNNAAPGTTNVGVLPGIANAAAPTYVEGDQVLSSIDLHGSTRNTPLDTTGVATTDTTAHAQKTLNVDSTGTAIPVSDGGAGGTSSNTTRTVTASDSPDVATLGATTDAAATAGSTGSVSAKLRLMTTQLDAIQTALQLIDDDQTGATPTGVTSAATTNSTNVKATAGRLMGMYLTNITTTTYYMRFYNTATNPPTCSSATNYVFTMAIPPAPASGQAGGYSMPFGPTGLAFSSGIGYCITGGPTSTDNTNAAVGIYGVLATK